ncbi:hypothetical protein IEQ34_027061 [Dendrobium chrysotoxum]|uniref:Uncharacterized protein n=1 Tax=Dendrobium chrysotoxum TaxID=161865 RepID=A0AAV7FI56_DENCH|nr:hypothetical protein IEQ34_027061 [Dendrobium chrysotoxum]
MSGQAMCVVGPISAVGFRPFHLGSVGPSYKMFRIGLGGFLAHPMGEPDLKPTTFCGLPSLWISEEEILALPAPLKFALVGFFPSHRLSLVSIQRFFFTLMFIREFSVTLLDHSHALIKLGNDLKYSRVFCHRSYLINN